MKVNPVGWFEIYVDDMKRACSFYEGVFQMKLARLVNIGVELFVFPKGMSEYGAPGALVKMEGVTPGGNSVLVYFSCQDCAVESGRVEKFGGRIFKDKFSIGEFGFIALCIDTEGNMFGMHSLA